MAALAEWLRRAMAVLTQSARRGLSATAVEAVEADEV
jgi:hypothetical protein